MSPTASVISPVASPVASPAHSVSSSSTQSRRVYTRRGSSSAADPWGTHLELNMDPARTTSCKLTIVRVYNEPTIQLDETPPSPQQRRHFGFSALHRRHGSSGSTSSAHSNGGKPENVRMSFASASFAGPGASSSGSRPSSPTATFTHGPGHLHRHSSSSKPRLTPDQLVNLAHQSVHPRAIPSPSQSPHSPAGTLVSSGGMSPASFTALADDIYLPFVDRAAEVTALFAPLQPSAKLFNLLAQTFPIHTNSPSPDDSAVLKTDPKLWSASQLEYWLKLVDRNVAPDDVWVAATRRCILAHSELVWERIKGALGIPPELDSDDIDVEVLDLDHRDLDSAVDELELDEPQVQAGPTGLVTETLVGTLSPERPSVPDASDHVHGDVDLYTEEDLPVVVPELSIEPVLAPTSPPIDHEHPPTRPGAHRMHDISEDVRGEEDDIPTDTPLLSPPREIVQGLIISTSPTVPGLFASESPAAHPSSVSPVPPSAFFADRPIPDDRLASSLISPRRDSSVGSTRGTGVEYAASTGSADVPYDAVGERGPGNPLFPASFARLALGPTLSANNPALRSPNPPPPPAFSNPHAIRAGVLRGRRAVPSWAEGWDPTKHEYAVTGSEGSVGGP